MIIKQKYPEDCGVACLAMFLNETYEFTMECIERELGRKGPIRGMNIEEVARVVKFAGTVPAVFRSLAPMVPAIISVPSLGTPKRFHYIYFDGENIFDPSNFDIYTNEDFSESLPMSECIVADYKFKAMAQLNNWTIPKHLYSEFDWDYINENK